MRLPRGGDCSIFKDSTLQMGFKLNKDVFGQMEKGDAMKTVYETFHQMQIIFNKGDHLPWAKNHIQPLRIALSILEDHLGMCAQPWVKNDDLNNNKKVQEYFRKLEQYLQKQRYSRCAWEMVRGEIRIIHVQFQSLMGKL